MSNIKINCDEANVLIFALNNVSYLDEQKFEGEGVSVSELYNKIYTVWETLYTNSKTVDFVEKKV
jgi:hypothetical protein